MSENLFYVYAHHKPNDAIPFYIGKGSKDRVYSKHERTFWWNNIVQKHGLEIQILWETLDETEAYTKEIEFIKHYGRQNIGTGPLINLTDGGEGASGNILSDDTKQKISEASRRMWDDPIQRTKMLKALNDPEVIARVTAARNTPEYKKTMSEQTINLWKDPSYIQKTLAGMNTTEALQRKSNVTTEVMNRPENKIKMSKRAVEMWKNPEFRKTCSENMIRLWKDPEWRSNTIRNHTKTHCKNGHPITEQGGKRECLICKVQRRKRYYDTVEKPKREPHAKS